MAQLIICVLGTFDARLRSGSPITLPTTKAQALLAYLAARPGHTYARVKLADLLWGNSGEEQARNSLRQTLLVLRRSLAKVKPPVLIVDARTVSLNPAAVQVDVASFDGEIARSGPKAMQRAVELYRGDLLEGFDVKETAFEEWLAAERERLRGAALETLTKLAAHWEKTGATHAAVEALTRLLALDPLQEDVHRTLMRLYVAENRRAAALRQYQLCVGVLRRELDIEPEEQTRALYQQILRQRVVAQPVVASPVPDQAAAPVISARPYETGVAETPLIGREREITQLRSAVDELAHGRGRTVAILGEAGVGKTRLVHEIAEDALARGYRVLWGRSYESERILAFGPWVDAFRHGLPISSVEVLGGFDPVWRRELGQVFPELGQPGLRSPSDPGNYLVIFEAIAQLTAYLAARQPLLIVLEDLHWADEVTARLLSFLGRRVHAWSALVLVTARQEELGDSLALRHALDELTREQRLVQVALSSLSRAEVLDLVKALAGTGRLDEMIWGASEGNPFMIFETIRALQEGARPRMRGGLPLPDRVRNLIMGRLERLSPVSQQLLAVAAVIGRPFDFALLHRASGLNAAQASEGVEELVRRRVLNGAEDQFDFTHERIREVAYGQLHPPRRKLLHRLVAEALEQTHSDDLTAHTTMLSVHCFEGELWDKALVHLTKAGSNAAARGAHREAVACFDKALLALQHLPDSRERIEQELELRFGLRTALLPLGDDARIVEQLDAAKQLVEALGDQRRLGWILAYHARELWLSGDSKKAIDSAERALAIGYSLADADLQVLANVRLGQAYHALGCYVPAMERLTKTIASLQGKAIGEYTGTAAPPSVIARIWLTLCFAERGAFDDAAPHAEEGIQIAEAIRQPYPLAAACFGAGYLHLRRGELQRAMSVLERGMLQCQERDIPVFFAWIASSLGFAQARAGDIPAGLVLMEQAVEPVRWTATVPQALPLLWLGEGYLLAGRHADALQTAQRALDLTRSRGERGDEAWALRLLGEIHGQRGHRALAAAHEMYGQALERASELGMRPLVAHCHRGLGALALRVGRDAETRPELSSALDLYREMGMTSWATDTESLVQRIEASKSSKSAKSSQPRRPAAT